MKRLSKMAKADGLTMEITEGGNHTKVTIGDRAFTVPRHNEIGESLAKAILKQAGGK